MARWGLAQRATECGRVNVTACEMPEGMDALIQKQFISAQYAGAFGPGALQEVCLDRRVNGIANPSPVAQLNSGKCVAAISAHPMWRAVDERVGAFTGGCQRWRRRDCHAGL